MTGKEKGSFNFSKIMGQTIYRKLGFYERKINKEKAIALKVERLEIESWKDPYVTELLASPLRETAEKILKNTAPDSRWTSALSIKCNVDRYGPEKVKDALNYGIPPDNLYYVCPVLDLLKAAKGKGGEPTNYALIFSGHVQGVGFRDTTFYMTHAFGLKWHYAGNMPDGTVAVGVTAPEPLLDLFLYALKEDFDIKDISIDKDVADLKPLKHRK